jgi:hypothetical protein
MNCASVDRFLEDEVKLRTLSGVGMTFDLALNKLASMVALVEAVKFYEAAGEEYEAVYGYQFAACSGQIGGQASRLHSRSAIGDGLKAFVKRLRMPSGYCCR